MNNIQDFCFERRSLSNFMTYIKGVQEIFALNSEYPDDNMEKLREILRVTFECRKDSYQHFPL